MKSRMPEREEPQLVDYSFTYGNQPYSGTCRLDQLADRIMRPYLEHPDPAPSWSEIKQTLAVRTVMPFIGCHPN